MVPDGWQKKTVGELCEFSNGNGFSANDRSESGLPIIRIQNLNGSREFNYFSGQPQEKWIVEPGQLLFAWAGTKGVSFGPTIWDGPRGVLNQHIYRLTPAKGVEKAWLYPLLRRVTDKVEAKAHGFKSTLVHVHKRDITDVVVPVPPAPEQFAIADTLAIWNSSIEVCRRLLDSATQHKKALAQQLLTGKRRLPGFSGKWIKVHLGEVFTERTETNRLELPLLSITSDRGVIPQSEVGRKDSSTEDKSKYKRIALGDIGYNSMRMWQGVSALSELEGIVSPAYTIVTPRKGIDAKFMSYLFKLPRTVHDFRRYSQGLTSDTWNLKFKQFREVSVRIPEFEEQQAIAKVFAMQDEVIAKLQVNKEKLELEKRALMQQLLTGKRRVKLPPEHATPAKEPA